MEKKSKYNLNHGFTIIELLVSLAILVIVLSIGYRLLFFGENTFAKGEKRYSAQESAQLASDLITRELRFAHNVIILPDFPSTFDDDKRYFYVDENGVLKHYLGYGNIVDAVGSLNLDVEFTNLSFSKSSDDILGFSISTESGSSNYFTESAIQILNILEGNSIDVSRLAHEDDSGPVISYYYSENEKRITRFALRTEENPSFPKTIEGYFRDEFDIVCYVQSGIDVSSLIPHIEHTGETITVNGIGQIPRVTSYNFTNPLVFTVVAKDGSTAEYSVEVKTIAGRPSATDVKIKVANKDNTIIPHGESKLEGFYTYISDNLINPDNEGKSLYQWQYSDRADFSNPQVFATTKDVVPKGLVGKYIRFGVMPVTKDMIPAENFTYSSIVKIYPPFDINTFWGSMINDIYTMNLPDDEKPNAFTSSVLYRTKYSTQSSLSSDNKEYSLTFAYNNYEAGANKGGSLLFKDVAGYVDNIESYKLTIDAEVNAGSGYGVLLYGALSNNGSDKNIDSGYMFHFDPGWNGFFVRKIENGNHTPWYLTYGVMSTNNENDLIYGGEDANQRSGIYFPQHIRNASFLWKNDNTNINDIKNQNIIIHQWMRRYKVEITTQRQLDNSLILRVVLIDESGNRSDEMWFGDFTEFNMDLYDGHGLRTYSTQAFKPRKLPDFTPTKGSMFGLRTWDGNYGDAKTIFRNITVEDGFSIDINSAKFIDNNTIHVRLNKPLLNTINKDLIMVKDQKVSDASITTINGEQVLIIRLLGDVDDNILNNGLVDSLIIERGGVRHYMAGDVEINDDNGFDISAR